MALTVVQGTLPADGQQVSPSTDLEAWINGTKVYGLDFATFAGSTLQVVYAQSEAPPVALRTRGMLWFKRGEGRLYILDQNDLPSGASSADERVINWLSISDRKDIWMKAVEPIQIGDPVQMAFSQSNFEEHQSTIPGDPGYFDPPWRIQWSATKMQSPYGVAPFSDPDPDSVANRATYLWFIALDSAESGAMFRAIELGFCQAYMGSGASNLYGEIGINESESNTMWYQRIDYKDALAGGASLNTGGYIYNAFLVESNATNYGGPWLANIFKIPHAPFGCCK